MTKYRDDEGVTLRQQQQQQQQNEESPHLGKYKKEPIL